MVARPPAHCAAPDPGPRRVQLAAATLHRWGRSAVGEHPGLDYRHSSHEFKVEVLVELFTLAVGPCQVLPDEALA